MNYSIQLQFQPVHEFMSSLHTYICRKSHKKIDLEKTWAIDVKAQLTPEFAALLDQSQIDEEWKYVYLLLLIHSELHTPEDFVSYLENSSPMSLHREFQAAGHRMGFEPSFFDTEQFLSKYVLMFREWNEQYFTRLEPTVLNALKQEFKERTEAQIQKDPYVFLDETTRGLMFDSTEGLRHLILIPQYHFQPLNVFWHYGNTILCHYAPPIYLGDEDVIPTPDLRVIRSLGEKNRLKILKYLHKGPRTFIEIVRHLDLSKGITHDHISKLRSAGLIYAHFNGENLVEYSIRTHALHNVQHTLLQYIENDLK
ncbi:ArsR family transcriptional regulator [Neobacillus mesonae]|nr:ArsR family transcriptional regulator [Neobacillus mesonae]